MSKKLAWGVALGLLAVAGPAFAQKGPEKPPFEEGMGPGGPRFQVDPEEEAKVLSFIREHAPEMARHFEEHPDEYRKRLPELAKMVRNPEIRDVFLKNMAADMKVRKLAEALRRAEGPEKERVKKELEAVLDEQFDVKLAQHELQIKKMQEEIVKLRARIESRRAKKAEMVKKRLTEMMGEGDGWDW